MGRAARWSLILFVSLLAVTLASSAMAQPAIGGDPRVNPADFRITTFATGLNYPNGLALLPDGSILVATSNSPVGAYFASSAELIRLVDANNDGVADGPGTVMFSDPAGTLSSVRVAGNLVFTTSVAPGSERIFVLRMSGGPAAPYTLAGSLNFTFPTGWEHKSYALAVRPSPAGGANRWELYFNVGSTSNSDQTAATVGLSGAITGTLQGASIYRVQVDDTPGGVVVSNLTRIAGGLRNAAGMDFHPTTGDFYFVDNGIDGLVDRTEPLSVDEMNRITAPNLGIGVPNFGFPSDYIEYRTGRRIGAGGVQPLATFQPIPAPGGSESEGPAGMSFAPAGFPAGLNNGIFVGFFGQFAAGPANEENAVVYYDLATGQYFHFIENRQAGIGHLDTLMATSDSLFIADLSSTGDLGTARSGRIYQYRRAQAAPSPLRLTVTAPTEGTTVSNTAWFTMWIEGPVAAGNRTFTVNVGGNVLGSTVTTSSGPVSVSWPTQGLRNGPVAVTAMVRDAAGSVGTVVRTVNIQNVQALTAAFTSPAAGATLSGAVTIGALETGGTGTISWSVTIDGVERFTGAGTPATASFSWDTTTVANGTRVLGLTVGDGGGRTASATRTVSVQNPIVRPLTASFAAPVDGATVSGSATILVLAAGAPDTSTAFTLLIDGGLLASQSAVASLNQMSVAWNTRLYADGPHVLDVTVRDSAGRVATARSTVTVRNAVPLPPPLSVSLSTPSEGATVSGVVTVSGSESGGTGTPIAFDLFVDGAASGSSAGSLTNVSVPWDSRTVANGAHTLMLRVTDGSGRTATAARTVNVQNVTGTLRVTITAPGEGSTATPTTWFIVWVEGAAAGSKTFTLSVGGGVAVNVQTSTASGPISMPWNTAGAPSGATAVTASVRDAAGNTGSAVRSVNVQNGGPAPLTVAFTSPSAGATVSGSVSVGASAGGASGTPVGLTLYVDGAQVATFQGTATTLSHAWSSTSVGNGSHTLMISARDGAGREVSATRAVNVQNTITAPQPAPPPPPPGTLRVRVADPVEGATVGAGLVWFTVWVDNGGTDAKTYTLSWGGFTVYTLVTTSNGPVSVGWDTTGAPSGLQTVTASVRDSTANTGSATRTVNVQNASVTPLPFSVAFAAPSADAAGVSGTTALRITTSNGGGKPIAYTVSVDGVQILVITTTSPTLDVQWNTATVANGARTLRVVARESVFGRSETATRVVNVGNGAAATGRVVITAPAENAIVREPAWFIVWIEGAPAGSKTYILNVNGVAVDTQTTTSSGPISMPWNTVGTPNGLRAVTATVRDAAGGTTSTTRTVNVQN